jgi:phosphoribosylformylglycinamidine synthase subunit PurSL
VADIDMEFLHGGYPQIKAAGSLPVVVGDEPEQSELPAIEESLINLLGAWNVCSKEWVIRQYDHEVQGGSVLKPLVGINSDGPGDAAVVKPLAESDRGIIVSNGINIRYGDLDPYWMTASVIEEALRQVIAVGGSLEQVALLDNFCWGDTAKPENLGALVRACEACRDMSLAYGTPFVSGKDSLNNDFEYGGKRISIPHTLLISAMAVTDDVNRTISMDFKQPGNHIYLIGNTFNELGGSEYLGINGCLGSRVPQVNTEKSKAIMDGLSRATAAGLVAACHDLSDGGLGVALAEMAFAGGFGAEISLKLVPLGEAMERDDYILFAESNSRFLAEVSPDKAAEFEKIMAGLPCAVIGETNGGDCLSVYDRNDEKLVALSIYELKEAWQRPLRW